MGGPSLPVQHTSLSAFTIIIQARYNELCIYSLFSMRKIWQTNKCGGLNCRVSTLWCGSQAWYFTVQIMGNTFIIKKNNLKKLPSACITTELSKTFFRDTIAGLPSSLWRWLYTVLSNLLIQLFLQGQVRDCTVYSSLFKKLLFKTYM